MAANEMLKTAQMKSLFPIDSETATLLRILQSLVFLNNMNSEPLASGTVAGNKCSTKSGPANAIFSPMFGESTFQAPYMPSGGPTLPLLKIASLFRDILHWLGPPVSLVRMIFADHGKGWQGVVFSLFLPFVQILNSRLEREILRRFQPDRL